MSDPASGALGRARSAKTALAPIFWFTWLNSFSTGAATTGIFFIAASAYGFDADQNYAVGLLMGMTYIAGSLFAGPLLRRAQRRFPDLSQRRVLLLVIGALALLSLVPGTVAALGFPGSLPIWLLVALYSPLTGVLWPVVEGYVSGGRSAKELRNAIGRFNIVWSSSLAVAFWVMGPLEAHSFVLLALLALLHLVGLVFLRAFAPEPAEHVEGEHEPHPAVYAQLLVVHRVLLATTYLVMFALVPYLPTICGELGIGKAWQAPLASIWLVARVFTFAIFARWHGWHGRWSTAATFAGVMLFGFGLTVLAPALATGAAGLALLAAGLFAFGIGAAALYTAALYYVMEVGKTGVDAGGSHEALIGLGYTIGPLCGLAASALVARGIVPESAREPCTLAAVAAASAAAALYAWRQAARLRAAAVGSAK